MGKALVANRTREIRPSGMTTGAYGNVDLKVYDSDRHVVAASSKALMKVNSGSSTRGSRAPYFYPDCGGCRVTGIPTATSELA